MISDVILLCALTAELTQSYTHGTCVRGYTHLRQEEDYDQSQVKAITGWKGDPRTKTTMSFRVEFADGDVIWLPYSKDLDQTEAFGRYTASLPTLEHLSYGPKRAREWLAEKRKAAIHGYAVGDVLYVDIRCYSFGWYDDVLTFLEDRYDKAYVVVYQITAVNPRYLCAYCPTYDELWQAASGLNKLDAYWCYTYGSTRELDDTMVLVTPELCRRYPALISPNEDTRKRVLAHHFPELAKSSRGKKKGKETGVAEPPSSAKDLLLVNVPSVVTAGAVDLASVEQALVDQHI